MSEIGIVAGIVILCYLLIKNNKPRFMKPVVLKTVKERVTIYPPESIDIRALQAQRDIIRPTLEVDGMYLIMDRVEDQGQKLKMFYNLRQNIEDNMKNRSQYILDMRHRDGNVLATPFNRKTNLPTPDFVGL